MEGNIEMGIHIVSEDIARQIDGVLTTLLFKKVFEEVGYEYQNDGYTHEECKAQDFVLQSDNVFNYVGYK